MAYCFVGGCFGKGKRRKMTNFSRGMGFLFLGDHGPTWIPLFQRIIRQNSKQEKSNA